MNRPEYTTLTLISTDPQFPRELREAIEAAGFTVARQYILFGGSITRRELPLECFVDIREPVLDRLHGEGITVLTDFTRMSFKDAWRLLLATPDDDAFTFRDVCRRFTTLKRSFTDLDPSQLDCWTSEKWKSYGLDGWAAAALVRLGIVGTQMLVAFTPDEIGAMYGIGRGERHQKVVALRSSLIS
jgi:hypothetical protein